MAEITLRGNPIHTSGELPPVGADARDFTLVDTQLKVVSLGDFKGRKKVLNVFPSIDTPVCATSVRTFNERVAAREDTVVINISADLPFAHKRFCGAEGIERCVGASTYRGSFATDYGVEIVDGPLAGLCSRAVIVLDEDDRVIHTELVPEIGQEPDYEQVLAALS